MPIYTFFLLDPNGATTGGTEAECRDDDAARRFADGLIKGEGQVEVWRGEDRVGWVFPRPYPNRV